MATDINNMDTYNNNEALMSAELSRFWSTVNRKFDHERPQLNFSPRVPVQLHDLVNADLQPENDPSNYLRETPTKLPEDLAAPVYEDDIGLVGVCDVEEEVLEVTRPTTTTTTTTTEDLHLCSNDRTGGVCVVDGGEIGGDVPATFIVSGLRHYECPVMGMYVHPDIVPGFSYKVRQLHSTRMLFKGRSLVLESIGRGYGKRVTFVGDSFNTNANYFWSDTHTQGYGFSIALVHQGDNFTIMDANNFTVATAQVNKVTEPQEEVEHTVNSLGCVEKKARVGLLCKVSYFDSARQQVHLLLVKGTAHAVKAKGSRSRAVLKKIVDCCVGEERGWTLVAGTDNVRVSVVSGENINDVPTKYSIKGLLPHELPVIGTYVDARIATGFHYRVRPADSRRPLFQGCPLLLQAIGRGYGKRLTFAGDKLNNNENYFWSDSNPEGYGFTIQAVSPGDYFRIRSSCDEDLGRARVFRADVPQVEESTTISTEGHLTKRVRVTLTCDITFNNEEDHTLIVTGTAVVERRGRVARVSRLEEVALGSQINVLFRHSSKTLLFVRE
ncbi:hypothetical protein Pmani_016127 [Petrolisthes manimaculis]|uniref:Uncharacterized protein n=1 Tax=Petrolisthes manimaculis TaxID=1843537 RepID=A0AAE1PSD6_9EUCA|nr:hypothetical protein Pmani_016127 [Petrolisthes manimaculis]